MNKQEKSERTEQGGQMQQPPTRNIIIRTAAVAGTKRAPEAIQQNGATSAKRSRLVTDQLNPTPGSTRGNLADHTYAAARPMQAVDLNVGAAQQGGMRMRSEEQKVVVAPSNTTPHTSIYNKVASRLHLAPLCVMRIRCKLVSLLARFRCAL